MYLLKTIYILIGVLCCNLCKGQDTIRDTGQKVKEYPRPPAPAYISPPPLSYDVPAKFPGGEAGWKSYIETSIKRKGVLKETEGLVVARFAVEPDGKIHIVNIQKSLFKEADEEVIRVLLRSPRWIPASRDGIPVSQTLSATITFKKGNK